MTAEYALRYAVQKLCDTALAYDRAIQGVAQDIAQSLDDETRVNITSGKKIVSVTSDELDCLYEAWQDAALSGKKLLEDLYGQ